MHIYGLDFTSAPGTHKPIVCVEGTLTRELLWVNAVLRFATLEQFEMFLQHNGSWIAGMDFPFGQPRQLIEDLEWPLAWAGYVGHVAAMGKKQFEQTLTAYRARQPAGSKEHRRATDIPADAQSPMKLAGVPVGKMFFEGAPRLLAANTSVLPCRPTDSGRIAVEAYPALVARNWIGRQSYKSDTRAKQSSAHVEARRTIANGLRSPDLQRLYGFSLAIQHVLFETCIADATGDTLDALLCTIQAAWAGTQHDRGYGIPAHCDALEGWIVDPSQVA